MKFRESLRKKTPNGYIIGKKYRGRGLYANHYWQVVDHSELDSNSIWFNERVTASSYYVYCLCIGEGEQNVWPKGLIIQVSLCDIEEIN